MTQKENAPFQVGDKVKKWIVYEEMLSSIIYTVESVGISWPKQSQSGWIVSASCENGKKRIEGFDSDWFVPAEGLDVYV